MVVLLYFDIMFKVRTSFFVTVNVLLIFAQTNEHLEKKLSPGFTFTLSLCQSTTTQPLLKALSDVTKVRSSGTVGCSDLIISDSKSSNFSRTALQAFPFNS